MKKIFVYIILIMGGLVTRLEADTNVWINDFREVSVNGTNRLMVSVTYPTNAIAVQLWIGTALVTGDWFRITTTAEVWGVASSPFGSDPKWRHYYLRDSAAHGLVTFRGQILTTNSPPQEQ